MSEVDLMSHTANRMTEVAADSAKNLAIRRATTWAKGYLPRFLWPLLPGQRGTVTGSVQAGVSKWFWGLVSSAVISALFFGFFALATLAFVAITLFAVFS